MIRTAIGIVWFIAAALLVYGGVLDAPFVHEDAAIQVDPDIREWLPPWTAVGASGDSAAAARPVVHYSLALNFAAGGLRPTGYRLLNLAVHLACTLVLFGVVRRTLLRWGGDDLGEASEGLAAATAMIWMLHPIQTECVNYISQRSESIMGLCYLLTLYASIRALETSRSYRWTIIAILCCALGMASKSAMVTAPLMVMLYDAVFSGRSAGPRWRERGLLYGGLAAGWLVLAGLTAAGSRSASAAWAPTTGVLDYAKNQCLVVVDYLRLVFWPDPLVLDYGYARILGFGDVAPRAALLVLLLGGTVAAFARWPKLAFPAAWTFVVLAPTSTLVPIATAVGAEHRMYLSLAGPVVLVVIGAHALMGRLGWGRHRRWAGMALLLVIAAPLAWRTVQRNADYAGPATLWQTVIDARPDNARAHGKLAQALRNAGRPDDAMIHFGRALELRGDDPEVLIAAGSLLLARGEQDDAMTYFRRALDSKPDHPEAHYNLAKAHQFRREVAEAEFHYLETLKSAPHHAKAHNNLGILLGSRGELDEAIQHFQEALRHSPGYVVARDNLEVALKRRAKAG